MDQHVQKEIVVQVVHIVEQDTIIQQDVIHVHGHQEHINVIVRHLLTNVVVIHMAAIVKQAVKHVIIILS